jgi:hypothetical protein
MLCVGAALLIVGAELHRIQPSRGTHPTGQLITTCPRRDVPFANLLVSSSSPPVPLRL